MQKHNTDQVSAETGWKLMADICHKADKNELLRKALKKIANFDQDALHKFLGTAPDTFGCIKRVVSDIHLEATDYVDVGDFFKSTHDGGIFGTICDIDAKLSDVFDLVVKNSLAKNLSRYENIRRSTLENMRRDAQMASLYEEVDLAHIKQICERHIIKKEKLLKEVEDVSGNFFVRSKTNLLYNFTIHRYQDEWNVLYSEYDTNEYYQAKGKHIQKRSAFEETLFAKS